MHFRISLAAIALTCICSATSFGQAAEGNGGQAAKPSAIALVDIGYLIQNHPTMKGEVEKIKEEMTRAQDEIETRRKDLLAQSESIGKTFDSNSPDFKQKQEELISKESRLRVDFLEKEKEFAERQAGVLAKSYKDITETIAIIAQYNKYDMVLRFSREQDEMDPKKPNTVHFGIQKDVVYQSAGMDLTDVTLTYLTQRLNAAPAAPQTATAPGGQNRVR